VERGALLLRDRRRKREGEKLLREGREILSENLEAYPDYGPNHYGLALADLAEGKDGDAERRLRTCLEKSPDYGPARDRLARFLLDRGRPDEAREVLRWYAAVEDSFDEQVDHLVRAALLLEDLGDFPSALACASKAWERNVTRFEPGSDRDDESEPRYNLSDRRVPQTLDLLAVNSALAGDDGAPRWLEAARALPRKPDDPAAAGLALLHAASAFARGDAAASLTAIVDAIAGPQGAEAMEILG
jgi:tetratricopeptide (TPR) repeat protein